MLEDSWEFTRRFKAKFHANNKFTVSRLFFLLYCTGCGNISIAGGSPEF